MQHRVNLYFNDENPIDAKIWNILKDKKKRPDFIKAMILGVIELESKQSATIDNNSNSAENNVEEQDDLSDLVPSDEIDLG